MTVIFHHPFHGVLRQAGFGFEIGGADGAVGAAGLAQAADLEGVAVGKGRQGRRHAAGAVVDEGDILLDDNGLPEEGQHDRLRVPRVDAGDRPLDDMFVGDTGGAPASGVGVEDTVNPDDHPLAQAAVVGLHGPVEGDGRVVAEPGGRLQGGYRDQPHGFD